MAAGVTLVAVDAVVNVPADFRVLEIVGVVSSVAAGALEYRVVVRVRVARRAHIVGVAMAGWKLRVLGVVEGRSGPGGRVMAGLARSRKELRLRRVAGIRRVVVVRLVAADAGRG